MGRSVAKQQRMGINCRRRSLCPIVLSLPNSFTSEHRIRISFVRRHSTKNYFFHFGSPRLKPETTDQLNLGVTWQKQFSNRFNLEITADGYLNHIKDKIVAIPYNMFIWTNVNIGKVQSKELKFRFAATINWQKSIIFCSSAAIVIRM